MGQLYESTFHGAKESELFFQYWKTEEPKVTVLITRGLSEHSDCYIELAERLNQSHFDVLAWDMRGHGRSAGKRGYVDDFADMEYDLFRFIEHVHNVDSMRPQKLVLFGHSLGGLVTAMSYIHYQFPEVKGMVLSAPAFGLSIKIPTWKRNFADIGARWFPKLTLSNDIHYDYLTSDEDKIKSFETDPLRHDKISPNLFLGMLHGFEYIETHEKDFKLPLLLQLSGKDKIVSLPAAIRFYEKISSHHKRLQIYENSLHEIYNDREKDEAFKDLSKFLNEVAQS